MDSESKGLPWVANLRHRFNTFCLEADSIIPQEPIEYVRNQFLTAGESLKLFYSELVEDALPILKVGSLEEHGPTSPKQQEITGLPSHKMSNTSVDDDQEGRSAVNSSSPLLRTEPVGEMYDDFSLKEKGNIGMRMGVVENPVMETTQSSKIEILATFSEPDGEGNNFRGLTVEEVECDAHTNLSTSVQSLVVDSSEKTEEICIFPEGKSAAELEEYKLPDDEVTYSASAWSTEAIQSCDSIRSECEPPNGLLEIELATLSDPGLPKRIHAGEAPDSYVTELGREATQPSGWETLDESLILVDSDEFCSDSDIEADNLFYQKTKTPVLNKKLAKKHSCETASQGIDAETDAKKWERLDEDFCDSDWEII
ncbi:hypothetical protein Pfo_012831 [Paulownia fortunei]|nr:hypothetical protein Pfo_012831 [Paulownia fortunei]